MISLRPCPCCASEAPVVQLIYSYNSGYRVHCRDCGLRTRSVTESRFHEEASLEDQVNTYSTDWCKSKVCELWNKRVRAEPTSSKFGDLTPTVKFIKHGVTWKKITKRSISDFQDAELLYSSQPENKTTVNAVHFDGTPNLKCAWFEDTDSVRRLVDSPTV